MSWHSTVGSEPAIDSGWKITSNFNFFFLPFFVVFSDTINNCFASISLRSLYRHLPYHNRTSTSSISVKSTSSDNLLCCLIDFTILDILIFGGRVFFKRISFNFGPLKRLVLVKDRQQFESKPLGYLICIVFSAHRAIERPHLPFSHDNSCCACAIHELKTTKWHLNISLQVCMQTHNHLKLQWKMTPTRKNLYLAEGQNVERIHASLTVMSRWPSWSLPPDRACSHVHWVFCVFHADFRP